MNRDEFRKLTDMRLKDEKVLLDAGRFEAAYYLAGYAVECALKACVCANTREFEFPRRNGAEYYQHDLQRLSILAGVENEFEQAREVDQTLAAAKNVFEAISDEQHGVLQWLSKYC